MNRKAVSGIMLILLLIGMLTLTFNVQPVKASGTIYIRADGSVEGTTHIASVDNVTYTFTGNIYDKIVVERDNIVVDGAGYTLQGTNAYDSKGIALFGRSNVTIKNTEIKAFGEGIHLYSSSNNAIFGNNIANNVYGIMLSSSSNNNTISGNHIANNRYGIWLYSSSNDLVVENTFVNDGLVVFHSYGNVVEGNLVNGKPLVYLEGVSDYAVGEAGQVILVNCTTITVENLNLSNTDVGVQLLRTNNTKIASNNIANNFCGIWLVGSSNNNISGNNIANNYGCGIVLWQSSNNIVYHNNFVDNTDQVCSRSSINVWDDGYPSGGNFWSDYTDEDLCSGPYQNITGSDGVWDHPYEIDADNIDNYPLVEPWSPLPRTIDELKTEIEKCWSEGEIDNHGIATSLLDKLNVAQKLVDKGKIDEAKRILEEDFIPQVQNLSNIHITLETADILIQSAEHILSHL